MDSGLNPRSSDSEAKVLSPAPYCQQRTLAFYRDALCAHQQLAIEGGAGSSELSNHATPLQTNPPPFF